MSEYEELLESMTVASRHFFRATADCLAAVAAEVSPPQYRALAILVIRGSQNSSTLAGELGVGRPAATKLVDRLVRAKLIQRHAHLHDRRQVILEPTTRGVEVVRAVQRCRRRRLAAVLGHLDPSARKGLSESLPALTSAFERAQRTEPGVKKS